MSKQFLIDRNGNLINLGSELGKGGEGAVFNIVGNPNIVAKIYLKPPDQEKSYKILNMVGAGNERLLKLAAWPVESIHSRSGDLLGFVMQKLQGYRPLFELYSPKLRLQLFPQADWRFLIHAATNTARAFSVIHKEGHVIGDVNHGNLLVASDATVKFIDTDSFQISINNQNWLCEVGVATHQPPEMQGRSTYKGIIRTPSQDNFGLAVLIFQLLCLARHPFSGRFLGNGEMPLEKAINDGRFAYSQDNRLTQMIPPPASLPMNALSYKIWSFFEKAFAKERARDGMRPTADEWVLALEELSTSLKVCQTNHGHHYLKSLTTCPWCDIELKSSITVFPIIIQFPNGNKSFHALWQQLIGIKDPGPAQSLLDITISPPLASKEAKEISKKVKQLKKRLLLVLGSVAFLTLSIGICSGYSLWQLILLGLGGWGLIYYNEERNKLIDDVEKQLTEIKKQWKEFSSNWTIWTSESAFTKTRRSLDELKKKYDSLQQDRSSQLQKLWDNRRQQQLVSHLNKYRIDMADLDGIGPGRCATLQSYAVETAADIEANRLFGISGFGPKLIKRLVDWRGRCTQTFIFDSSKGVSQSEIQSVDRDMMNKRYKLEQELATGLASLASINNQIQQRRSQLHSQALSMINNYAQIVANAREVGINS